MREEIKLEKHLEKNEKKDKTNMDVKYVNDNSSFNSFTFQCASSPTYDVYGIYSGIDNKYVKYKYKGVI